MLKITAASFIIVAVCLLQTAYAGLLDSLPNLPSLGSQRNSVLDRVNNAKNGLSDKLQLDSVLGDVQNKVSNSVKNLEDQVSSSVKNLRSQLEAKLYATQEQLQNSEACTRLRSEGEQSLGQLASNFNSCLSKETQAAGKEYQELSNSLSSVVASVTSTIENIVNDLQNNPSLETATYAIENVQQLITQITPLIEKAGSVVLGLPNIFSSVSTCYRLAFLQAVGPVASNLVKDGQKCASNVYQALIS